MEANSRRQILIILFLGVLMGALDIAIVGPALPAIGQDFGVDERGQSWLFTSYVLLNLIGAPLMAKLSDRYGRRNVYLLDIALFGAGSLLVAIAPSYWLLLVGRAAQGLGAGGVFPVAGAVIGDTFPEDKRGSALGLIGAVFGISFIIGPILGGILLLFSWKWLFLINVPFAVFTIWMAARKLPTSRLATRLPFDALGMLALTVMLSGMTIGISQLETGDLLSSLLSWQVGPFLLLTLICIPLFIWREKRAPDPIIHPRLLGTKQMLLVNGLSIGAGAGEGAMVFLPAMAVASFAVTKSTASFLLMPVVLAMAVGSPMAGRYLDKFGSKKVLLFGTTATTLGIFILSVLGEQLWAYIVAEIIIGLGLGGLLGAPLRYILLAEASLEDRAAAQGMLPVSSGIGQLLSGALVGAVADSLGGSTSGYKAAFVCVAVVALVMVFLALLLKNRQQEQADILATK
ncbi:MFS transporter [Candidatus Chlorohelix sp.]|uniref:MFS transporter n=1 Tax=Candidatus Chlorohelix sp. TaxID=3139201 RepID=UPI003065E37E